MYCPFCKRDDVREVDFRLDDGDPIHKCFDCGKIYHVEVYYEKNGMLLSEEQHLAEQKPNF